VAEAKCGVDPAHHDFFSGRGRGHWLFAGETTHQPAKAEAQMSMRSLQGLGLVGEQYGDSAMSGIFSDIVGNIFGGGKSKEKETIVKPAKAGGGGVKPLTVGLIAGGALAVGMILYGSFKR
jgi:hypothetical protein